MPNIPSTAPMGTITREESHTPTMYTVDLNSEPSRSPSLTSEDSDVGCNIGCLPRIKFGRKR